MKMKPKYYRAMQHRVPTLKGDCMATKELKVCDAYGTMKDVMSVTATVSTTLVDGHTSELLFSGDLSARGRKRLAGLLAKGFSSASRPMSKGCQAAEPVPAAWRYGSRPDWLLKGDQCQQSES